MSIWWVAAALAVEVETSGGLTLGAEDGGAVVHVLPDVDDDDANGLADWFDVAPSTEERARVVLRGVTATTQLRLEGEDFRVWHDGQIVMDAYRESWEPGAADVLEIWVQARTFRSHGLLHVDEVEVALVSSPWVLPHALLPITEIFVVQLDPLWHDGDNAALITTVGAATGARVTPLATLQTAPDLWVRDAFVPGFATVPGEDLEVWLDGRRDGLGASGEHLLTEARAGRTDVGVLRVGSRESSDQDAGGNILVSPPLPGAPLGRIILGANTDGVGIDPALLTFLQQSTIQDPIQINLGPSCVGHADEVLAFVPDATAPHGFRALVPDTALGEKVLRRVEPRAYLSAYAVSREDSGFGIFRVSGLLSESLVAYNAGLQKDWLDPLVADIVAKLGLDDAEVVHLPAWFEPALLDGEPCGAGALVPNPINGLYGVGPTGLPFAILPDPILRPPGSDRLSDPWMWEVARRMPAGTSVHWVDDFDAYHSYGGEVHCGTQVRQRPEAPWWRHPLP